jgi:hypothetical protein
MNYVVEISSKDLLYLNLDLPTVNLHTKNYFGEPVVADSVEVAVKISIDKISEMCKSFGLDTAIDYGKETVTAYSGKLPVVEYFNFTIVKCYS